MMKTKAIELRGAVENAIVVKECQNIEYKSNWHDDYLKWICGYANAQGGVIYFGMDDDHKVVGLEDVERLLEDIPNKICTTMGILVGKGLLQNLRGLQSRRPADAHRRAALRRYISELSTGLRCCKRKEKCPQ